MRIHSLFKALWPAVAFLVVGCKPPSLEDLQRDAAENVSSLLTEAWDAAADSTNGSPALANFMQALNLTLVESGRTAQSQPPVPRHDDRASSSVQSSFDAAKTFLNERVLTKANIESTGLGDVTFKVDGQRLCEDRTSHVASPNCVKMVDDLELRIVVAGDPHATLTLRILAGKARHAPAVLTFENGHAITVEVDFAEYQAALNGLASSASNPLPATMTGDGQMRYRLEKLAPRDFVVTAALTRAYSMSMDSAAGTRRWSLGASNPTYRVRFNGATGIHEASVQFANASYDGAWGDFVGTKDTTPVHAEAPLLKVDLTTDVAPELVRGTVWFERARVTVGGGELMSAALAQPVTLRLLRHTDGHLKLAVSDTDLTLGLHLARGPGTHPEPAVADATWHLKVGQDAALELIARGTGLAARVLSGTLSLEVPEAGRRLSASSGECLYGTSSTNQDTWPVFSALTSGACP